MGYAGGTSEDPNYSRLGDHTETVQIDFDPQRISYAELLKIFWQSHDPRARNGARQYMNAVFYHNERQRRLALKSKSALEKDTGAAVHSRILALGTFYRAEGFHQKYMLRQRAELSRQLHRIYPREQDFIDSTAAARLNGYAGGYGSPQQLDREIDLLGLNAKGRQALAAMAGAGK